MKKVKRPKRNETKMYEYTVSVLFLLLFWCPCMAINVAVSVQYNGELLPDIILLTQ